MVGLELERDHSAAEFGSADGRVAFVCKQSRTWHMGGGPVPEDGRSGSTACYCDKKRVGDGPSELSLLIPLEERMSV
jgi:hypothetical protein